MSDKTQKAIKKISDIISVCVVNKWTGQLKFIINITQGGIGNCEVIKKEGLHRGEG